MSSRLSALAAAAAVGASVVTAAVAGPAQADPPTWSLKMNTHYALPVGTRLEWFYVNGSGQCFQQLNPGQVMWTDTVQNPDVPRTQTMFTTWPSGIEQSCTWKRSYATWQVRITTPDHVVKTGSLFFTTGVPNPATNHGEVSCRDFSNFTCVGDSKTVFATADVTLDVTLGPVSTAGTGGAVTGSLAFGS